MKKKLTINDIKKKIYTNYRYGECIKMLIRFEKNEKQKLELIDYLAHYYTNHVTGRYSDDFLENELVRIGKKISFNHRGEVSHDKVLMVMTRAASVGGHTAIVNNWIEFDESREYSVVFTEGTIRDVPRFLIRSIYKSGGKVIFLHRKDRIEKVKELLKISDQYEKIVLHTHMYDTIPILAYSNENWKRPVYFYNHANFLFSLGMSMSDCVLNMCEYDNIKTQNYRGGKNSTLLYIPNKIITQVDCELDKDCLKKFLCNKYKFPFDAQIILSMGADFKYNSILGYDFVKFVKGVLKRLPENTYFFIIGADKNREKWKALSEATKGRAQALGILPRDEVTKWIRVADAYVTSFPMTAAGATEARQNGVPCFRMDLIGNGAEFNDGYSFSSLGQLVEKLCKVVSGEEMYHIAKNEKYEIRDNSSKWCGMLDGVFKQTMHHQLHTFQSRMVIGREEIINYQLGLIEYPYDGWKKINVKNKCIIRILNWMVKANRMKY